MSEGPCPQCGKQVAWVSRTPHHVVWNHVDGTRCVKCHHILDDCLWCGPRAKPRPRKRRGIRQLVHCIHRDRDVAWGPPITVQAIVKLEQRSGDCKCGVLIVSVGRPGWLTERSV